MAIQNRRGAYVDLNPAKAVPGELLVVQSGDPNTTDGKAVYMTFASGDIKLLAMRSDVETAVADVAEDLLAELDNTISTFTETTAPGAVADVADEGAAQITAIGNKGDEVLGSIPSDYSTLSGDVSDLKSAITEITDYTNEGTTKKNGWTISGTGLWQAGSTLYSYLVKVASGESVEITPVSSGRVYYTMLTGYPKPTAWGTPNYCSGFSGIIAVTTKTTVTVPNDAVYMWFAGNQYTPSKIAINGYDISKSVRDAIETNKAGIANNANKIDVLDGRIDRLELTADELIKYGSITNLLENGDFHNATTGLIFNNCTATANNNVLTLSGNGGGTSMAMQYYYPVSDPAANPLFAGVWVKVTTACNMLILRIAGANNSLWIPSPEVGKWYYVAERYVGTAATSLYTIILSVTAEYSDSTAQANATVEIKQATVFLLNTDFGIGIKPPLYKLLKIMEYNDFWLGTKNVIVWKADEPVTSVPKQKWSFGQKHRPLVTFVDDDGWERIAQRLYPISAKYNVPMVTAMSIDSTLKDWWVLHLQNELGWEIAAHPSDGNLAAKETEAEIEQVMTDTNEYLSDRGFKWENVVYANGEPDERVRRIAKKYYRCGCVGSNPRINKGVIANFEINRIPIGYPYADSDEKNTFAYLKQFIDQAVANNGWCIFMTHVGMTNYHTDTIDSIIDSLIDYAVNTCGIDVVTLNDGFNVFGNAVECGDFVGENGYHGDDPTRGIALSQTGELGNIINLRTLNNLMTVLNTATGGTFTKTYNDATGAYEFTYTPSS